MTIASASRDNQKIKREWKIILIKFKKSLTKCYSYFVIFELVLVVF